MKRYHLSVLFLAVALAVIAVACDQQPKPTAEAGPKAYPSCDIEMLDGRGMVYRTWQSLGTVTIYSGSEAQFTNFETGKIVSIVGHFIITQR